MFISINIYGQGVLILEIPLDKQLVSRDLGSNLGSFNVAGEVERDGSRIEPPSSPASFDYDYIIARVFKEGSLDQIINSNVLSYDSNDVAEFDINIQIQAELSNYSVRLFGKVYSSSAEEEITLPSGTGTDIVAGDVFIIQGQSNAEAKMWDGSSFAFKNKFIRVFGSSTKKSDVLLGNSGHKIWKEGDGDILVSIPGGTGQWGLRLAREIIDNHNVPIAIFNGARGNKPIQYFQEGTPPPSDEDSMNNYERLKYRLETTNLENSVRAIFWSQGENDGFESTTLANYKLRFEDLVTSWKADYGYEKLYIFQTKSTCGTKAIKQIQEAQRQLADEDPDIQIMQTTGLDYANECHFSFSGGYEEFALRIFKLVNRDIYGHSYGVTEIETPQIDLAYLESDDQLVIETNADQLTNNSIPTSVFLLEDPDGAEINSVAIDPSNGNKIILELSKKPNASATISYLGLGSSENSSNLITNSSGIEIICFDKYPITSGTTWTGNMWDPINPTEAMNAVIDGSYDESDGNIVSRNLTVNSGKTLNFDSGNTNGNSSIIVYGDLTVEGSMIIGDTESLLIKDPNSAVTINGTFNKMERSTPLINQYDVTYWASPVQNIDLGIAFNGVDANRIFEYDPKVTNPLYTESYFKYRHWHIVSGNMVPGKGYSVDGTTNGSYPNLQMEINFVGIPNYQDITIPIGTNASITNDEDKVNLIGNPYPSAIDANQLISENSDKFQGSLYLWSHASEYLSGEYDVNDYFTYNNAGSNLSIIPEPYYIASGQGFMVMTDESNTTFTFRSSMQVENENLNFFKGSKSKSIRSKREIQRIWLHLTKDDEIKKEILIGFSDMASDGIDTGYDAQLFTSDDRLKFYSLLSNLKLSIQTLKEIDYSKKISLGFSNSTSGQLRLGISKVEGELGMNEIYIEDRLLGITYNLFQSDYEFDQIEAGEFEDRFSLFFSDSILTETVVDEELEITVSENVIHIKGPKKIKKIEIYDMLGRLLAHSSTYKKDVDFEIKELKKGTIIMISLVLLDNDRIVKKAIVH